MRRDAGARGFSPDEEAALRLIGRREGGAPVAAADREI
jgi:hypothetical protein